MNVKDGYDDAESVSARSKGYLLMIEKFQAEVRLSCCYRVQCC